MNKENKTNNKRERCYALMLFETALDMGIKNAKPNTWINTANQYYSNGVEALNAYTNTPCPASQLIAAESKDELNTLMEEMKSNFKNYKWIEKNIFPYM